MVVNMSHNLSHMYYSYNSNIKCVGSIINCVVFKLIYYVINIDDVSSFMILAILIIYFYRIV